MMKRKYSISYVRTQYRFVLLRGGGELLVFRFRTGMTLKLLATPSPSTCLDCNAPFLCFVIITEHTICNYLFFLFEVFREVSVK